MSCNTKNTDKYEDFRNRLKELMKIKNFKTKSEFAKWLGVARNTLSMVENGYRPPSDAFLQSLFLKTGKPSEYWLYGVEGKDYINKREEFKMLKRALDDILELNLMDLNGQYTSKENKILAEQLLDSALKADIHHILEKKKQG